MSATNKVTTIKALSLQFAFSASGNNAPVSSSSSYPELENRDSIPRMRRYAGITRAMQANAMIKARNVDSTFID